MIQKHINSMGEDYRLEINGTHPVQSFQDRTVVPMADSCILEG